VAVTVRELIQKLLDLVLGGNLYASDIIYVEIRNADECNQAYRISNTFWDTNDDGSRYFTIVAEP